MARNTSNPGSGLINRRSFLTSLTAGTVALMAGGSISRMAAAGGNRGFIVQQGAELFVHPSNLSPILYMDEGTPVDVLYGPYAGMYEVRYYATDGWVWEDYLSFDGWTSSSTSASSSGSAPTAAYSEEHWIDVNRSSGLVRLMIGDSTYASFWGSLGWDTSDYGFYATAIGTYYVYGFVKELHYTSFADNYITHWVAFDPDRYNGFHSYTKDKYGDIVPRGGGHTGGCVALAPGDIDQLYDFATMGMRVEIHW